MYPSAHPVVSCLPAPRAAGFGKTVGRDEQRSVWAYGRIAASAVLLEGKRDTLGRSVGSAASAASERRTLEETTCDKDCFSTGIFRSRIPSSPPHEPQRAFVRFALGTGQILGATLAFQVPIKTGVNALFRRPVSGARSRSSANGAMVSAFVRARKPATAIQLADKVRNVPAAKALNTALELLGEVSPSEDKGVGCEQMFASKARGLL